MASASNGSDVKPVAGKPVDQPPPVTNQAASDTKPPASTSENACVAVKSTDSADVYRAPADLNLPVVGVVEATRARDPFDPSKLTLKQDFVGAAGVKKLVTMVPVRKPTKFEWVWVHDDPAYQLTTAALAYKEDREEIYLVAPELWPRLAGELRPIALFTTINRQGVLSLWPVKLPGPDGRHDSWNASALDAVGRAKTQWTRVVADMNLGGYSLFVAGADLEPPQWPELSFKEILGLAFRDRYIESAEHLVIKKLRGEA